VVAAVQRGFDNWRAMTAVERARILRRAAALLRERAAESSRLETLEQGKPLTESTGEAPRSVRVPEAAA
jgi:succinate-semialdehyde dehydrogenase/glutarate-semialdehyde dehydrogenase